MTLSEKIADLLSYYINGTIDRRCVSNNGCYYSGTNSTNDTEGCFIGRMLKPEDRIKADEYFKIEKYGDSFLKDLIRLRETFNIEIPQIIMDNQNLFSNLQRFHDDRNYWGNNGLLNAEGIYKLKRIIVKFDLDEKDFQKFLN